MTEARAMPAARPPTAVFGPLADDYASARPLYPEAMFDAIWARLPAVPPRAIDLAAGAGAATVSLAARGARVTAVEPSLAMLRHARGRLSQRALRASLVAARAEALPLAPGSLDLVAVGQAFHWFEPPAALAEIARVLTRRGVLAVFWNVVVADDFGHAVAALVERWNTGYGRPVSQKMRGTPAALGSHPDFDVEPPIEIEHERAMDAERYVRYAFSWSYVGGALGPSERLGFERELRATIERHHGSAAWHERFVAALHLARRR